MAETPMTNHTDSCFVCALSCLAVLASTSGQGRDTPYCVLDVKSCECFLNGLLKLDVSSLPGYYLCMSTRIHKEKARDEDLPHNVTAL